GSFELAGATSWAAMAPGSTGTFASRMKAHHSAVISASLITTTRVRWRTRIWSDGFMSGLRGVWNRHIKDRANVGIGEKIDVNQKAGSAGLLEGFFRDSV